MSTDATKFPDGPSISGQQAKSKPLSSPIDARLIGLPTDAKGSTQVVRVSGEVIRADADGNIRVRTDDGQTVDIKIAKTETKALELLQKGQRVDIDIPPEKPQAEVNVSERVERDVRITPRRGPTEQSSEQIKQPPQSDISQPVRTDISKSQPAATTESKASDYPQIKLPIVPIRLEPLPPELETQIITPISTSVETKLAALPVQIAEQQTKAIQNLIPAAATIAPLPETAPAAQPITTTPQILPQSISITAIPLVIEMATGTAENSALQSTQSFPAIAKPSAQTAPILLQTTQAQITIAPDSKGILQSSFALPAANTKPVLNINIPANVAPTTIAIAKPNPGETILSQLAFRSVPTTQHAFTPAPLAVTAETPITQGTLLDIKAPQVQFFAPLGESAAPLNILSPKISNISIGQSEATFIGTTPAKLPVVNFPAAQNGKAAGEKGTNFVLHHPLGNIPVGATLTLQTSGMVTVPAQGPATPENLSNPNIIKTTLSAPTTQPATMPAQNYTMLYGMPAIPAYFQMPESWPLMNDIYQTLQSQSPQGARVMNALTPSPANAPANLAGAALFFIAAVKGGDIQSWLGEKAIESLRKAGRGDALSRLSSESSTLSRMARDAQAGEWRGLSIPFMAEHDIQKIAFYYKHDYPDQENEEERGEKRTRFIFDLSLSKMGMVQLDGMHKGKNLDMVLRTAEPFTQAARAAMKQLYIQCLEDTNLHGELSFHSRPDQWVKVPLKDENQTLKI